MDLPPIAPDGFEFIRFLGSGGTAGVVLARRIVDSKPVAIKYPLTNSPESNALFLRLIRREGELIKGYRYPGLVRILDLCETLEPYPYLAMEYCPGKTLDMVGKIGELSNLINLLSSISANLYYLNIIGLYHGDLKLQNIFIHPNFADPKNSANARSKLSDFSLALRAGEDISARLGVGTVGFMAPETVERGVLNHKSDIFAYGAIAYFLATGKHPFMDDESDPVRVNAMIKEYNPQSPAVLRNDLPSALSDLIMEALDKDPEKRPGDGYVVCDRLAQLGADFPYKRLIRPKYILDARTEKSNSDILNESPFRLEENIRERILDYSGEDRRELRHILEINFSLYNLFWEDGTIRSKDNPDDLIWPARMQKRLGVGFTGLKFSDKKKVALGSLVNNIDDAVRIGALQHSEARLISRPLSRLIKQNLSNAFVRRFSSDLARRALETAQAEPLAAELFLQAGNLEEGFPAILDAGNVLVNRHEAEKAVKLLDKAEQLCLQKNAQDKLKIVLMNKADALKMIGVARDAEENYLRIIDLYKNKPPDKLLAETHKDLGDLYKMKLDYPAGISALEKAKQIYAELGDELELSHTLNNIGNIYAIGNQFESAFINYRRALRMQNRLGSLKDIASTLGNIAYIYYIRGRYDRTINLFLLALKYNREIGNRLEEARTLNNLGSLSYEIGRYDKAFDYLQESLAINRKIGNKKEILFNLENLTLAEIYCGKLKESTLLLREGLNLSSELGDMPHLANFTGNMAVVQKRMGFYGQALKNSEKALKLSETFDDKRDPITWNLNLADIYYRINDIARASHAMKEALHLAQAYGEEKALLAIYSLQGLIECNPEIFHRCDEIADRIKSHREKNVMLLRKAQTFYKLEQYEKALEVLGCAAESFAGNAAEIETAAYYNTAGCCRLAINYVEDAKADFEKAERVSNKISLLPELIDAWTNLGKIHSLQGDFESAFNCYKKGVKGLKRMADDLTDDNMKASFLSDGKIASLTGEINKLSAVLTKNKKAGR
jgi:serine/threonine protein kinase/Tfp pilus assembly protein PilF